ncbi:hypothetical protein Tco_0885352, partial [Tanacetum coccineum]
MRSPILRQPSVMFVLLGGCRILPIQAFSVYKCFFRHYPESKHCEAQSHVNDRVRKLSSLQLCMQLNDVSLNFGYEPVDSSKNDSGNIWDYSDNEAAPVSSWSALPN